MGEVGEKGAGAGIVLVLNWPVSVPGGVTRVVHNASAQLARLGWAPTILVNDWNAQAPETDQNREFPVVFWRIRGPWETDKPLRSIISYVLGLPRAGRAWLRLVREMRWVVVNCHFPDASASLWMLLRSMGLWEGVVILSVHGGEIRNALLSRDRVGRFFFRRVLIGADAIVSCSGELAADVAILAPEARARIHVIHNGVDFEALAAQVSPDFKLPSELESRRFILNVATYEPKKSQETLISAFSMLASQFRDVHLVMIGRQTPWIELVRERAEASGYSNRIHFLVDLPHEAMANWLSRATVFCLPSQSEGHPLALMEAAAFELPVVATSIGGVTDIMAGTDDGLLVPVGNVEALAKALSQLLGDPATAALKGRNLSRSVQSRYSWTETGQKYSDLCQSLLSRRYPSTVPPFVGGGSDAKVRG